jgi:hypothetical protein
MAYTETTSEGYGTRVGNSFKGIFTGIILFIGATVLLWWNEGRAVKTAKMLDQVQKEVVEMPDVAKVDASFEGKLIHATGTAVTNDTISDDMFSSATANATSISRLVEYYQYEEESKTQTHEKIGGTKETTTTYTYKRTWSDKPIDSGSFHDPQYQSSNFTLVQLGDDSKPGDNPVVKYADNVDFGAYTIPDFLKSSIGTSVPLTLDSAKVENDMDELSKAIDPARVTQYTETDSTGKRTTHSGNMVSYRRNVIYVGHSASSPQIGDVRITFTQVPPKNDISIIAKVAGNTFQKFTAKNGKTFATIYKGKVSSEEMLTQEKENNDIMTWILRAVGLLLAIFGLKSMFGFISMILVFLPFLKDLTGAIIGFACAILGFVWSLLVIAIAWLFYRPVLGIILIVIAVALIVWLKKRAKAKSENGPGGGGGNGMPSQTMAQMKQQQFQQQQAQQQQQMPPQMPQQQQMPPQQPQHPQSLGDQLKQAIGDSAKNWLNGQNNQAPRQ